MQGWHLEFKFQCPQPTKIHACLFYLFQMDRKDFDSRTKPSNTHLLSLFTWKICVSYKYFFSSFSFHSNNYLLSICMPKNMNIYKNKMSYKQKKYCLHWWNSCCEIPQNWNKTNNIFWFLIGKISHMKKKHTSLFCNKIGIKSALLLVWFYFTWF